MNLIILMNHDAYSSSNKISYQMSINRGITTTNQGTHARRNENSLISSLSVLVKSFEEEIQPSEDCLDTARG